MPVNQSEVAVGTAITTISGPSIGKRYVYIQNSDYDGTTEVYVGGETVGTATGVRAWRDQNMVFEMNADDVLCAIGDGAAAKVRVVTIS